MVYTMQPTGVSRSHCDCSPYVAPYYIPTTKYPQQNAHRISSQTIPNWYSTSPLTNKPSLEAFRTRTEFWGYQPSGSRIRISVTTTPNRFPCSNHWTIGIASNPENLCQDPWRTWNHPWNNPWNPSSLSSWIIPQIEIGELSPVANHLRSLGWSSYESGDLGEFYGLSFLS